MKLFDELILWIKRNSLIKVSLIQPLLEWDISTLSIPIAVKEIDVLDECDVDNEMRLVLQQPLLHESKAMVLRVS